MSGISTSSMNKQPFSIDLDYVHIASVVQGTWSNRNYRINYEQFDNTATKASGDEINFELYLQQGTYLVIVEFRKESVCGIIKVNEGATNIITADGYSAGAVETNTATGTWTVTTSGKKTLRVFSNTKNAAASDYRIMGILKLIRTG